MCACVRACMRVCYCVCYCVTYAVMVLLPHRQVEIKLIWLRADPDAVPVDATFIECMMGVYKPCFDKPYASTRINNYQFNSIPTMMVMGEMFVSVYLSVFHCLRLILITPLRNYECSAHVVPSEYNLSVAIRNTPLSGRLMFYFPKPSINLTLKPTSAKKLALCFVKAHAYKQAFLV